MRRYKTKTAQIPICWRKVSIRQSVLFGFFDIKGMPVTRDKAATRLAKETAVLLSEAPVESFPLLTVKEDILVLVVPKSHLPISEGGTTFDPRTGYPEPVISAPAADDPPLPSQITFPPATALAQISPQGDLSLRLLDAEIDNKPFPVPSYTFREKMDLGTFSIKDALRENASGAKQGLRPTGWRKATLKGGDSLVILDTKGKPVTREDAAKRLAKETPVLIHFEPVDPLQMSASKEDTLLLVVPVELFAKMPFGQCFPAVPVSAPSALLVKRKDRSLPRQEEAPLQAPKPLNQTPAGAIPLPAPGLVYLETGLAQATDNDAIVVKVVDYQSGHGIQKAKYEPVSPAKAEETNATAHLKIDQFMTSTPVPRKWRLLALKREEAGFAMHDCKGNAIPWEKARIMLEQESPVLLSPTPIDPQRLSVMRDDALVLVIPPELLYPNANRVKATAIDAPFAKPTPAKPSEMPSEPQSLRKFP